MSRIKKYKNFQIRKERVSLKKYNFIIFTVLFTLIFAVVFCRGYFGHSQSAEVGKTTIEVPVSDQNSAVLDNCPKCNCGCEK
jgi:hypothetical protein